MHMPVLSFCIPWVCCVDFGWKTFLALVLTLAAIRCVALHISYRSKRERLEFCRKWAIQEAEHVLPYFKKEATNRDPEIDHDSEWATAYSVAIDRNLVSACLALDTLDRNWPWETAEVRKALARADKCARVMSRNASAVTKRFLDVTRGLERLAEKD